MNKELLIEEYTNKKKPMWQIAKEQGVAIGKVYNYLKRHGIPTRPRITPETIEKIRAGNTGKKRGPLRMTEEHRANIRKANMARRGAFYVKTEFGGHTKKRDDGYIAVYVPSHPRANSDGYVMEHHLVMEKHLGRLIAPGEVVHHINGVRDDNRIENLMVMTAKEHMSLHMKERHAKRKEG